MPLDSTPAYSGFRLKTGQVYNEAAFRYFLAVDRWRAQRSIRLVLLALVSIRQGPGRGAQLEQHIAAAIFSGLAACVREVDFVGWYHEGRVAGAVLAQGCGVVDERGSVAKRLLETLKKHVPADPAQSLQVRVIRLGGRPQADAI